MASSRAPLPWCGSTWRAWCYLVISPLFLAFTALSYQVRIYLEGVVLPDTTAHQPSKLSANGQDLGGEMLFSTRIAFSGTPSSLLPLEMGECRFAQGDDAKMLATLTNPRVVHTDALPTGWSVAAVLEKVAALRPPVHALIDAGALITGYSNLEVEI